jgi:hypothetical protein
LPAFTQEFIVVVFTGVLYGGIEQFTTGDGFETILQQGPLEA